MFDELLKQSAKCGVGTIDFIQFYLIDSMDRKPSDGWLLKTMQAPFIFCYLLLKMQ